ncbi:MAG: TolC family protein [Pseudomonadota bacterium]
MKIKIWSFIMLISLLQLLPTSRVWASELKLDLRESISLALRKNPQVLITEEERKIAEEKIVEARAAALPEAKATGQYTRLDTPSTYLGRAIGDEDNFSVNFGLEQSLYTGGKVWSALRIAGLYKAYSDLGSKLTRNQVTYQTKNGYYTILFLRELVKIRQESVKLLEEHLDITRKKFEVGLVSNFEVLRAEVELANAKPPLIKARNQLGRTGDSFKKLLGLDLAVRLALEGNLSYVPERIIPLEDAIGIADKERPDLGQQKLIKKINEEQLNIAKSGYKPKLSLFANYEGMSPESSSTNHDWGWGWNAGLKAEMPLFSGFATKSQVSQSVIEMKKADIVYRDMKEEIKLEIRNSLDEIQEAIQTINSQEKNVEQAMEGLRIAEIRYKNEVSPQIEVMDAQVALTAARVNHFQAIYDYEIALAKLELAVGGDMADTRKTGE